LENAKELHKGPGKLEILRRFGRFDNSKGFTAKHGRARINAGIY